MPLGALLLIALAVGLADEPWVLQPLGNFLVVRDPLEPVDAVIAISGDGTGERVSTAAGLIRRGYGRWLILSGSTAGYSPGGATAEMATVALGMGVSQERILIDDRSVSTFDNATHSAELMRARGLRRAILVTSPYHTRRASWIFRRAFRSRGLDVRVYATENSFFDVRMWWTRGQDRGLVIREYRKLAAFLVGLR